jgi:hypothetical protein
MSREIDLTKRLSEDELKYLVDRDRWDDLRENARNLDLPEPNLPSARGIRMQVPRKQLQHNEAFDDIAKQMGVQLSDDDGDGDAGPSQGTVRSEGPVDYNELTVPQLKEELDKRRADYEKSGDSDAVADVSYTKDEKKADLVAKLQLDDEASAEDDEAAEG